jgi:hypothetical protein
MYTGRRGNASGAGAGLAGCDSDSAVGDRGHAACYGHGKRGSDCKRGEDAGCISGRKKESHGEEDNGAVREVSGEGEQCGEKV